MKIQDPRKAALQVIGLLTGVASILYFVYSSNLGLSPVTTSAVGLFVAGGLLVASLRASDTWDAVLLYVLSGVAFLGGCLRLVTAYSLTDVGTLAVLLTVTAAAFGLSRYRTDLPVPSRTVVRVAVVGALVLSVAFVGVDVTTGDVTYSADTVDRVSVPPNDREIRLGTVTYTNPSPIPREAGYPRYQGCMVGVNLSRDSGHVGIQVDRRSNALVSGRTSTTSSMTAYVDPERVNATSFAVVRTESCPDSAVEPTIAVYRETPRYR